MKKILIAGLIVVLFASAGYAYIEKDVTVHGIHSISSKILGADVFTGVDFVRIRSRFWIKSSWIYLSRVESEWFFFVEEPLVIKIGRKFYYLPLAETGSKNFFIEGGGLYTYGRWRINKKIEREILKADSITIRVPYSNHPATIWEVPSEVLNEWKQVIRMKF